LFLSINRTFYFYTVLTCRTWQFRRIVVTKNSIAFSQPEKTTLIDIIPLVEISGVRIVSGLGHAQGQWTGFWGQKRESESENAAKINGSYIFSDVEASAPGSALETATPVFSNGRDRQFQDAFTVETIPDGHNSGRIYHIRTSSQEKSHEMVASLKNRVAAARREIHARNRFRRNRDRLRRLYDSKFFQYTVAALILAVGAYLCILKLDHLNI
jgi:hypothetical protein